MFTIPSNWTEIDFAPDLDGALATDNPFRSEILAAVLHEDLVWTQDRVINRVIQRVDFSSTSRHAVRFSIDYDIDQIESEYLKLDGAFRFMVLHDMVKEPIRDLSVSDGSGRLRMLDSWRTDSISAAWASRLLAQSVGAEFVDMRTFERIRSVCANRPAGAITAAHDLIGVEPGSLTASQRDAYDFLSSRASRFPILVYTDCRSGLIHFAFTYAPEPSGTESPVPESYVARVDCNADIGKSYHLELRAPHGMCVGPVAPEPTATDYSVNPEVASSSRHVYLRRRDQERNVQQRPILFQSVVALNESEFRTSASATTYGATLISGSVIGLMIVLKLCHAELRSGANPSSTIPSATFALTLAFGYLLTSGKHKLVRQTSNRLRRRMILVSLVVLTMIVAATTAGEFQIGEAKLLLCLGGLWILLAAVSFRHATETRVRRSWMNGMLPTWRP